MSTQLSSPPSGVSPGGGGQPRQANANVYAVMLILSAVFMLIAVIAMIMEYKRYAPDYWKTTTARPSVSAQSVDDLRVVGSSLG